MGAAGAQAFAEQVDEGNVSLATAVSWHLTSNHYPPLPAFFVPVAIRAIELGQAEEWDAEIDLPLGCVEHEVVIADWNEVEHATCELDNVVQWRGREDGKVRVGDVVESFHLDSFL
jgi:hypothetical protein